MKKVIVIVLLVIAVLVIWVGATYASRRNEMVRKREQVNAVWSQVRGGAPT